MAEKAGILDPEEMVVARQRLGEHAFSVSDKKQRQSNS
jgi:hypothetical protein